MVPRILENGRYAGWIGTINVAIVHVSIGSISMLCASRYMYAFATGIVLFSIPRRWR